MCVPNPPLNDDKQMVTPFNISEKSLKSWFMAKLSIILLIQTLLRFEKLIKYNGILLIIIYKCN